MSFAAAIIVAAGRGTRMGSNVDKLFLEVAGRPLVAHTWAAFDSAPDIQEIVLVVRPEMRPEFDQLAARCHFRKAFLYADGGAERQHSVWNGLEQLSPAARWVLIHDGARPCVTHRIISDCLAAAAATGASVAAQRVTDTLKEAGEGGLIARNVDRSKLWAVQTPQAFQVPVIRRALAEVLTRGLHVTDDTAACELIGQPVTLVESHTANPKATSRADLPLIELLLRDQRVGPAPE